MVLRVSRSAARPRKTVGRGRSSGHGKTSGRGQKGQNSRSGGRVRIGFEGGQMPLYRRIARRGFSNYRFKKRSVIVNIGLLDRVFRSGEVVSMQSLLERKLISPGSGVVKILADGGISQQITVDGVPISAHAARKIEAAGGTVVQVKQLPQGAGDEQKDEQKEENGSVTQTAEIKDAETKK